MPARPVSHEQMQDAVNLVEQANGNVKEAARISGMPYSTFIWRYKQACLKNIKPSERREEIKARVRQRLGKMHMVIPDVQSKPGVRNDHLEWIGNYAVDKKPDVIVCIGDWWDMESLSIYDKGKRPFEGRRYEKCVASGKAAMKKFFKPIDDYNRTSSIKYEPRKVFCGGNHEHRIVRLVDNNPEYEGKFSLDDLGIKEFGWEFHDFLKVVEIDGIEYSHYFTSGTMGRPVSSAAAMLRERQRSCTMGHVQHTDIAMHKKTQQIGLFCGTCYLHDENYLGYQGNSQRRQIVVKHEVEEGRYDPMFVSLNFLEKSYS